jgi:hypothetical protein
VPGQPAIGEVEAAAAVGWWNLKGWNGAEGPVRSPFTWYHRSERQFVVRDDHPLGWRGLVSLSCRVLDVGAVDGEDDVTHFVDQLEDGERCFG